MSYVVAVLSIAALCVLSYLVQRWAGREAAPPCGDPGADCADCGVREPGAGRAGDG